MRFLKLSLCFTFATILSGYSLAAEVAKQTENTVSQKTSSATTTPSSLILGFKSLDLSGRAATINDDDGRIVKSKNEVYLGWRDQSGWGGYVQGVQYYHEYRNNPEKSKWSAGDSSVTLLHPDWYQSPTTSVFGQFRYYIPTTEWSKEKSINHYAYYLRVNTVLTAGHEIFNELVPRYFDNKIYDVGDTTGYAEDMLVYTYKINKSWKCGVRSYAQYEYHVEDPEGFSLEAGPHISYSFNSNFSISSGVWFPLVAKNKVYDGPRSVSTDQAFLDVFISAKL